MPISSFHDMSIVLSIPNIVKHRSHVWCQGVLESFLGHLLAGGVFCLFAGQPLTVLGCTGPVLIFEKILMDFCLSYGLNYLTTRYTVSSPDMYAYLVYLRNVLQFCIIIRADIHWFISYHRSLKLKTAQCRNLWTSVPTLHGYNLLKSVKVVLIDS